MLLKFTWRIFVCDQFVSSLELSGSSVSDQAILFDPINLGVTVVMYVKIYIWAKWDLVTLGGVGPYIEKMVHHYGLCKIKYS